jgi:hypothetical protein
MIAWLDVRADIVLGFRVGPLAFARLRFRAFGFVVWVDPPSGGV